jgi:formate-dependent phosphoribosylglycinamide formyltransferase (GAR transformylase)
MPVSDDIDDSKLERLAAEKGVGTIVKPVANGAGEGKLLTTTKPELEKAADTGTPRGEMKSLNLELPGYVWTELKIRAAQRQTSLKHVVMSAMVRDGISIQPADMIEDGRRLRGSSGAS